MSNIRGFKAKASTLARAGVVAAAVVAVLAHMGEIEAGAQSAGAGGSGSTGAPPNVTPPPSNIGIAGAPNVSFADNFEGTDPWGFWSTSSTGHGYVSSRPADAFSPVHVGDLYDERGASPGYEFLSKSFTLATTSSVGRCEALIFIKPLTAVTGELDILDPTDKAILASNPFTLAATAQWTAVSAAGSASAALNVISVKVVLSHNGTWQEFLVDDLSGACLPQSP